MFVAAAGGLEGDVECAVGALEVPHLGSPERGPVMVEGEALLLDVGADAGPEFSESGRETRHLSRSVAGVKSTSRVMRRGTENWAAEPPITT